MRKNEKKKITKESFCNKELEIVLNNEGEKILNSHSKKLIEQKTNEDQKTKKKNDNTITTQQYRKLLTHTQIVCIPK